jgi:hypothetical protein
MISICSHCESDSNEIDGSESYVEKLDGPRLSIFHGISIDSSSDHFNSSCSIRVSRELDSNEIHEGDLRVEKYDDPRISTCPGISVDRSDEHAPDLIRVHHETDSNKIEIEWNVCSGCGCDHPRPQFLFKLHQSPV